MPFNLFFMLLIAAGLHMGYTIVDARGMRSSFKLGSFSWSDCGSASEMVQVQSFTMQPDPIQIPGNISIGIQATVGQTETSPLPLSIVMKKKVLFFWVTVPCEDSFGSCSYDDFCQHFPNPCPAAFKSHGFDCQCPVSGGSYNIPLSPAFTIGSTSIPSWLETGDYKLEARVNDGTGTEIVCLDIDFSIEANDSNILH